MAQQTALSLIGSLILIFLPLFVTPFTITTPPGDGETFTVDENKAVNFVITTFKVSGTASGADVAYTLDATCAAKFGFKESTGQTEADLFVAAGLDYEGTPKIYSCTASITENGGTAVTRTFKVNLVNVYDVAPTLSATSFTCSVDEEVGAGTKCTLTPAFTVSDTESSYGDTYTCALSGPQSTLFDIDSSTCDVSVKAKYDRETMPNKGPFSGLTITVSDKGANTVTAALTITINDINDNTPVCTVPAFAFSIPENTASGTVIRSISCTDADAGTNKDMQCSTSTTTQFTTVMTGSVCELKTSTAFDYDTMSPTTVSVVVYVEDKGTTPKTASMTFQVTITGINDNDPTWGTWSPAKPAAATTPIKTVPENSPAGFNVFQAVATDADKGETVTYSITTVSGSLSSYFSISNGVVTMARSDINRETTSEVDITVEATDGTKKISATVRVAIGAVNEFAPTFTPSASYIDSVNEGTAADTDVLTMTVSDADLPAPTIVCEITSGNAAGVWKLKTGATNILQTAKILTIDKPTSLGLTYGLGILCKDNGGTSPFKSSPATISLTINAISNDHAPTITLSPTSQNVNEDATTVDISTIAVADNDGGTPGVTECRIVSPVGSPFALEGCAKVKRTGTLDYESTTSYSLVIEVKDKGTSPKSASATLTVNVQNVDDNDPTCPNSPFSFTKSEAVASGTAVGTVTCADADNDGFTYSIITTGMPFAIDSTSGAITTSGTLDYDDKASTPYYQFNVRAVDKGSRGLSTTAQVTVTVTNDNEATPTFTAKTQDVLESTPAGSVLTTFTAVDADGGADGELVYSIVSVDNSGTGKFGIDASTGKVTLLSALDFDSMGTKDYKVTVKAEDKGGADKKSGTGILTISVKDVNDATPVFATTTYSGTIAENANVADAVTGGPVAATDADSAPFSTIHYSITAGNTGGIFQVGTTTGAVTVASATLNYEATNSYTLTIKATDNAGTGPNTATCNYVISVTDFNEFTPVFSPTTSAVSKDESTTVGALIFDAKAIVSDGDTGQTLTFKLDPTHPSFTINANTGKIYLAKAFDFETTPSFSLTVKATDNVATFKTGSMTLGVTVNNVNEFDPVCSLNPTIGTADEATAPKTVTTIYCTDGDTTTAFVYTIVSVNSITGAGKFQMVSNNLNLATAIDYDTATAERVNLVIIRIDDGGPGTSRLTSVTATVNISPVNEADPVITSGTTATVKENAAVDTDIHSFTATDADKGSNHDTITWSIQSGNTHNYYKIDGTKLKVNSPPDREIEATATLKIRATDGGGRKSEQDLVITVTEVNDNPPVFNPTSKVVNVLETSAVGFIVDDFTVTGRVSDKDTGAAGTFTLSILSGSDSKFALNANKLEVSGALEAKTKNYYSMVIRAVDQGTDPGPLTTDMTFVVNVQETNDVTPTFTTSGHTVTAAENTAIGAEIYDADATDTDGGLSGTIKFSLASGDTYGNFLVDENTGKVLIKAALDYEKPNKVHHLVIHGTDSGSSPKTGSMTLTVSVTDYNDNQPVFTSPAAKTIDEDVAPGVKVLDATVTDNDSGVNGDVVFSISSGAGIFAINPTSGAITTTATSDREVQETYILQLKAVDKGTPALTGYQTLTITINDKNDNTPTFSGAPFVYGVKEDVVTGTAVATTSATDSDKPGTANSAITYSLVPADGVSDISFFSIDAGGIIKTAKLLDRESIDYYQIHVLAKDGGSPVLTGTLAINVSVIDVNDNTPVITGSPYTASISEGAGQGVLVQAISASDSDTGVNAVLTYTVVDGDTASQFMTTTDGKVVTAKSTGLDRETTPQYVLKVRVNDNGATKNSATATVTVNLLDVNDNKPKFGSATYTRLVAEKSPVDTPVGTAVTATDADLGANGAISYALTSQSPATGHFKVVAASGQIQVALNSLDRETIATYVVVLEARDNGFPSLTGTTTVTIQLTDVNDNTPVFGANYSVGLAVAENTAIGTTITTIVATDKDLANHNNSNITFSIDATKAQGARAVVLFAVDARTGALTVKTPPDYESDKSVGFYVVATDKGTSTLSSSTYVFITITDVNDNAPVFSQSFYDFEMVYNDIYEAVVGLISATDKDSANNGVVGYHFAENAVYVVIDSVSGTVKRATNHQSTPGEKHVHIVVASDKGSPTQSTQVTMRVDTHDPEVTMVKMTFSLSQEAFLAKLSKILASLQSTLTFKYPDCTVKYWRHEKSSVTNIATRRRLLANGVSSYFYVVADKKTNSAANVVQKKSFITNNELLTFWRSDTSGTPTPGLRGTSFTDTPIVSVEKYPQTDTTPWYTTAWGIAVLTIAAALFLLALAIIIFVCCRLWKRRQRGYLRQSRVVNMSERTYQPPLPKEKHPPPKFGIRESPPPAYDAVPPSANQIYRDPKALTANDKPQTAKTGRAVDYERVVTPEGPPPSRNRLILTGNNPNEGKRSVTPVDVGF